MPASGNYRIWGRIKAADTNDNSFFVSIDGTNEALWDTPVSSTWRWDPVSDRDGDDPVIYFLQAGEHSLMIERREDGAKIDKILITNDPGYSPEGMGDEISSQDIPDPPDIRL